MVGHWTTLPKFVYADIEEVSLEDFSKLLTNLLNVGN
jgi:hypothetical protein